MSAYDEGSTVTAYAEEIARKHFSLNGTFVLQVVREVGLTPDLSGLRFRRFKQVRFWFGTREPKYLGLDREELVWLRDSIDQVLAATEEFAEQSVIDCEQEQVS